MALLRSLCGDLRRRWALVAPLAIVTATAGCHPWSTPTVDSTVNQIADDKPPPPPRRATIDPRNPNAAKPTSPASKLDPLADPYWVPVAAGFDNSLADAIAAAKRYSNRPRSAANASPAVGSPNSQNIATDTQRRWRHPGLEKLIAQRPGRDDRQSYLREALASHDPIVATNAAILLVRDENSAAVEPVARAIESSHTNIWQRRAAIDALAAVEDPSIVSRLQKLVDELGDFSAAARQGYVAEIHAELLAALVRVEIAQGRKSPEVGEPRFTAALGSPAALVRREALLGLANPWSGPPPPNVVRYATDEDRQVRRAAMIAIAARRHPEALEVMRRGLLDQDPAVRMAAIAGLGLIADSQPEAVTELKKLSTNSAELIRAAAYDALLDGDDPDALEAAAGDKSERVRRLAAAALARNANRRGRQLAEKLVCDSNADVAKQTIDAVAQWPLEQAGPVLLKAMEGMPYTRRKLAAAQLGARWPPAIGFEVDAPADRRAPLIADLQRQWAAQFGGNLGAASPPEHRDAPPTADAELAAVERLNSGDLDDRRRAAAALRAGFASRPLAEPALARLAALMVRESDTLVWVNIFDLLAGDAREQAIGLAYGALGHPSPEVRRRACEYLAAHPATRHGPLLLVSLSDPNPAVVAAAVRAIGRLNALQDRQPLERLLASDDHELRVEVAKALVHVGDDAGIPALDRLAYDPDPKVRRATAQAMGEVPDDSFLPDLIRLLDDRPEIRRAALHSLPRVAGRELPANSTTAKSDPASEAEHWKEWYRRQPTVNLEPSQR